MQPLDISNPASDDYAPDDDYDLEEARQELAEQMAWVELGGANVPKLTVLDTTTGIAYLYERSFRGACLVAVVEDGGELAAKMLAVYTHAVAPLGDVLDDDNPYSADEATAIERARDLSLKHRTRAYEVYEVTGDRVALVCDGVVYCPKA